MNIVKTFPDGKFSKNMRGCFNNLPISAFYAGNLLKVLDFFHSVFKNIADLLILIQSSQKSTAIGQCEQQNMLPSRWNYVPLYSYFNYHNYNGFSVALFFAELYHWVTSKERINLIKSSKSFARFVQFAKI